MDAQGAVTSRDAGFSLSLSLSLSLSRSRSLSVSFSEWLRAACAGSPALCQTPIVPSPPPPVDPAGTFSQTYGSTLTFILHINDVTCCWPRAAVVYNQNRACKGAYTSEPSLCEGTESHPAVLLALGMLPGEQHGIDKAIMNRTLDEGAPSSLALCLCLCLCASVCLSYSVCASLVLKTWNLPDAWGWDFGLMAMTAARLGRNDAAEILMTAATKNEYPLRASHLECIY